MKTLLVAVFAGLLASNVLAQDKPAAPVSPAAAAAAAPAAPAADDKAVVPEDKVLKEDKEKQTEEARRAAAAERAAAEKDRRDQLFKACTIKPVMTDDEIEACKKAYAA